MKLICLSLTHTHLQDKSGIIRLVKEEARGAAKAEAVGLEQLRRQPTYPSLLLHCAHLSHVEDLIPPLLNSSTEKWGCILDLKIRALCYPGDLFLLSAILQVSKVEESVIRAARCRGRAGSQRGPSSIPAQLPSVQQFEVSSL